MTPKTLFLLVFVGLSATVAAASGLRGGETAAKEDPQSRRKLPPGQPNYGLTPSEHMAIYGWKDPAGYYGEYGYYDGGDYERGRYGNPWGNANYYDTWGGSYVSTDDYYSDDYYSDDYYGDDDYTEVVTHPEVTHPEVIHTDDNYYDDYYGDDDSTDDYYTTTTWGWNNRWNNNGWGGNRWNTNGYYANAWGGWNYNRWNNNSWNSGGYYYYNQPGRHGGWIRRWG